MSIGLQAAAAEFLADRHARGYGVGDHGCLIASFLDDLDRRGVTTIGVADAIAFAQKPSGTHRRWHVTRLQVLRGFAAYVHLRDPASADLIPAGLITAPYTRRNPYLYSATQIGQLMSRAETLAPAGRAAAMHTMIGLIAATGLRSGEAVGLDVHDLCVADRLLRVTGKLGQKRQIPLHATTVDALVTYQQGRAPAATAGGALLIGPKGGRLNLNYARATFRTVADACGLAHRPGCLAPRLHDLRHTFAVNTLIDAHRDGVDVDARVAALATYLGHRDPANTYWYLTASPELMEVVAARIAAHRERRPT